MAIARPSEGDILAQDTQLRAALRGGEQEAGKAITLSAEQLHAALQRANDAVRAEHRSATNTWRSPLSLFDETAALAKGVPSWAVDAVLKAQRLGFEAAQLDDRTDAYQAQIVMAKREGRGIARAALLQQLEQLDGLAQRLRVHLPRLQAARAAFDAPCPAALPPQAASVAERAAAEAERRGGAPSLGEAGVDAPAVAEPEPELELPACILQERPARGGRGFWRGVVRRSQERMPRMLESALDAGVGRLLSALESMGMAQAQAPSAGCRGETARVLALPWSEVSGRPPPWLAAEDSAEMRRQLARALEERGSPAESAKSRWERCRRRTDRRWTLA